MMVSLLTHICVTRPQWVKQIRHLWHRGLRLHRIFVNTRLHSISSLSGLWYFISHDKFGSHKTCKVINPKFMTSMPRGATQYDMCLQIRHTVKPVCNEHLYNKIHYLWFIQECGLMKTEGTNLLLLPISAFWSSSRWPLATLMSSKRRRNIPLGGRYRQVSLYLLKFFRVTLLILG